ncbi:MAG TPA: SusD/RagB family nutrient-binding outer membrane lipoprotein [Longimicrobium sp.]
MRNLTQLGRALSAAALAASLGACSDFIDNVPGNENVVQNASVSQLLTSVQLRTWLFNEGHVARATSVWLNQLSGIDRQFSSLDQYVYSEDEFDNEMSGLYAGSGLQDLRLARAKADSQNLTATSAVLKIHEAFLFGMAASMWGDLPYSQAGGGAVAPESPVDAQEAVYASVQTLLDQAITTLSAAPSASDLALLGDRDQSFAGNTAAWRRVAQSLKARYYMHWVEAQGAGGAAATAANTACAGNCLTKALAAAQAGINSAAGDWNSVHTGASTEQNWWYQFSNERSGYMAAGRLMVDSLKARGDGRLTVYFAGTPASITGSKPGENNGAASTLNLDAGGIAAADAGIALVTCAETQFIIAEAQYRLGAAPATIYTALNAGVACEQARHGTSAIAAVPALTGAALFHEIMMQKYFAQFLNMDAMNDYKRTCQPNVAAAVKVGSPVQNDPIPSRLLYGQSERQANSDNLSAPGTGNNGIRNRNDPISCASVTGLAGA